MYVNYLDFAPQIWWANCFNIYYLNAALNAWRCNESVWMVPGTVTE